MAKKVKNLAAKPKGSKQGDKKKAAPKSVPPAKASKPAAKPAPKAIKSKVPPKKASGKTFAPTKAAKDSVTKSTTKPVPKKAAPPKSLPAKTKSVPKSIKPTEKSEKPVKSTSKTKEAPAATKAKAPVEKAVSPAKKAPAEKPTAKSVTPAKPAPAAKAAPTAPATVPAKSSSKKTTPAPTPTPIPEPLPKIKKSLIGLDNAPEIVIKQAYNPTKLPPFVRKQQQRLFELRSALLDSMDGVAKETLRSRPEGSDASVGGMHMGDAGSDAYDRDFALSMLSKEQDALYEINEALKRLDSGVYGVCEMSGQKISEERLEALPYTRYTRDMQEQIERDQIGGKFRRPVVRSVFGLDDENEDDDDDEEEGGTTSNSNNESSLDFIKE